MSRLNKEWEEYEKSDNHDLKITVGDINKGLKKLIEVEHFSCIDLHDNGVYENMDSFKKRIAHIVSEVNGKREKNGKISTQVDSDNNPVYQSNKLSENTWATLRNLFMKELDYLKSFECYANKGLWSGNIEWGKISLKDEFSHMCNEASEYFMFVDSKYFASDDYVYNFEMIFGELSFKTESKRSKGKGKPRERIESGVPINTKVQLNTTVCFKGITICEITHSEFDFVCICNYLDSNDLSEGYWYNEENCEWERDYLLKKIKKEKTLNRGVLVDNKAKFFVYKLLKDLENIEIHDTRAEIEKILNKHDEDILGNIF